MFMDVYMKAKRSLWEMLRSALLLSRSGTI